jgi:hypothetical protein
MYIKWCIPVVLVGFFYIFLIISNKINTKCCPPFWIPDSLHIILYIWIFPRYLLIYSIFDKMHIDKHIKNYLKRYILANIIIVLLFDFSDIFVVNRRYCYRTLYPPFWIYERLLITLYISIKTYYLVFILKKNNDHIYWNISF